MKTLIAVLVLIVLVGCGPANRGPCKVEESRVWEDAEGPRYDLSVSSAGNPNQWIYGVGKDQFNRYSQIGTEYHGPLSGDYCK